MARLRRRIEPDTIPDVWLLAALRHHRGPLSPTSARMLDDLEGHVRARPASPERARLLEQIGEVRRR